MADEVLMIDAARNESNGIFNQIAQEPPELTAMDMITKKGLGFLQKPRQMK